MIDSPEAPAPLVDALRATLHTWTGDASVHDVRTIEAGFVDVLRGNGERERVPRHAEGPLFEVLRAQGLGAGTRTWGLPAGARLTAVLLADQRVACRWQRVRLPPESLDALVRDGWFPAEIAEELRQPVAQRVGELAFIALVDPLMSQRRRGGETVAVRLQAPAQLQQREIMGGQLIFLSH